MNNRKQYGAETEKRKKQLHRDGIRSREEGKGKKNQMENYSAQHTHFSPLMFWVFSRLPNTQHKLHLSWNNLGSQATVQEKIANLSECFRYFPVLNHFEIWRRRWTSLKVFNNKETESNICVYSPSISKCARLILCSCKEYLNCRPTQSQTNT